MALMVPGNASRGRDSPDNEVIYGVLFVFVGVFFFVCVCVCVCVCVSPVFFACIAFPFSLKV